ncbi:MAG: FISUMP domain-containing protein [Bacteroidota bacterium]
MKNIYLIIVLIAGALLVAGCNNNDEMMKDKDGNEYKTIKVGEQVWMAENMNYATESGSWHYNDNPENGDLYGRLYTWETACEVCPDGWHLPTAEEWEQLIEFVESSIENSDSANMKLQVAKALAAPTGWTSTGAEKSVAAESSSNNKTGFSAVPGGYRYYGGNYYNHGHVGMWWTSSKLPISKEVYRSVYYISNRSVGGDFVSGWYGAAVRCVKDSEKPPEQDANKAFPGMMKNPPQIDTTTFNDQSDKKPGYVALHESGELKKRGEKLWERMYNCDICPHNCKVNRLEGERGVCGANDKLEIATYGAHFGEDYAFVGKGGTGRIFFTNCPLRCVHCIDAKVSQEGYGKQYSIDELSDIMLSLQQEGSENITLVTPTHYIPHILLALDIAAGKGLHLPLIFNTGGYENADVLKNYLDGVVDIYLSDIKYGCNENAGKYTGGADDYVDSTYNAIVEMQRQVGVAAKDSATGLWKSGLILRHLVLPNDVACSKEMLEWIAENLPKDTYIDIMPNYEPLYKAQFYPKINRRTNEEEYLEVMEAAKSYGLTNVH